MGALGGASATPRAAEAVRTAVGPTKRTSDGASAVPDAARRRVDEERERQDQRFVPARTLAEKQEAAAARERADAVSRAGPQNNDERTRAAQGEPRFANRVGYFDGTTIMFVDLVDARTQRELLRIFGPSAPPKGDPKEPEDVSRAYRQAGRRSSGSSRLEA
jgi:hypothetical protein